MKIINKIRAFFTFKGEKQEMELSAAEVKENGVFLHPVDDPKHTFFVKSNSVDIFINPDREISENDIFTVDKETVKKSGTNDNNMKEGETYINIRPLALSKFMPAKRRFSVMLYQDEYDTLIKNITENGYKKAEYFLACMTSAKKQNFDATYKKYTTEHKQRYKNDMNEAKRAQAEDYIARKNNAENREV